MSSLRELQAAFAAGLRGGPAEGIAAEIVGNGVDAALRLEVYRHNSAAVFEAALGQTYPIVKRRVGEAHFGHLAALYRQAHPSRSGDLHWAGRRFAAFLAERFAGTAYAWLADLARLEWLCEEALVAAHAPPVPPDVLRGLAPDAFDSVRLSLQPSTRCASSVYPIFTIWRDNQSAEAAPVDLDRGAEHIVLHCARDGLRLYARSAAEVTFVERLAAGASLGDAFEDSALSPDAVRAALVWLFAEGFVTGRS